MKDIKQREHNRDIKTMKKSSPNVRSAKDSIVRSKENLLKDTDIDENVTSSSPYSYADDMISSKGKQSARVVADRSMYAARSVKDRKAKSATHWNEVKEVVRDGTEDIKKDWKQVKKKPYNKPKAEKPYDSKIQTDLMRKKGTDKLSNKRLAKKSPRVSAPIESPKRTIKTAESISTKTIKTAQKGVGTAKSGVKTAQRTSKTAIKTTKTASKAARKTAVAAQKAAQRTIQYTRLAAKTAAKSAKLAVKASISMVKAIIASTKALVAAIMAGGWIAILFMVIICMIGMLVGSVFGIFFSGEDTGTGMTMPMAVREINKEYDDKLESIKTSNPHDTLEMSGSRAVWKEVLSLYSVKTNTDPDEPMEVASMDDKRYKLLSDIFWSMNEVSHKTTKHEVTEVIVGEDDEGNLVESEVTTTKTTLYITVSHKTAEEKAKELGFNKEQNKLLAELLSEEYDSLWSQVLYGISYGSSDIVAVALSQVGNVGGYPYWSWYGFSSREEWCACFVSWCAEQCGYIEMGVIPKFASCNSQGVPWFRERGQYRDRNYEPVAGDIIFFDWSHPIYGQDGSADHVGIVERVENGRVYTIEGNSNDACKQNSYPIGYYEIHGYGVPAY